MNKDFGWIAIMLLILSGHPVFAVLLALIIL